jgi:hypothetical protein
MTLDSEDAVKKALGINSFREMSKEKMLAFAASMPDMANEVRLKLIDQIPGFQKFALDAVNAVERTFEKTLESVDKNQEELRDSLGDIRSVIKGRLDRDGISEEHERFLVEKLLETGGMEAEQATENKKFKGEQANETRKSVLALAGIGLVAAVVLAGGKVMIGRGGSQA